MTIEEFTMIGKKLGFTAISKYYGVALYWTDLRVLDYHGNKMDVMRYDKDGRIVYWDWESTNKGIRHTTGEGWTINHDEAENILCKFKRDVKAMLKTRRKMMIEEL